MTTRSPFGNEPDPELGGWVGEAVEGPDPDRFLARLGAFLADLPSRRSPWDVLAEWAQPSVLLAAMAAGFLLGLALWQGWRSRVAAPAGSATSVAMMDTIKPVQAQAIYTVLEER